MDDGHKSDTDRQSKWTSPLGLELQVPMPPHHLHGVRRPGLVLLHKLLQAFYEVHRASSVISCLAKGPNT
jgi:hypothetical protein